MSIEDIKGALELHRIDQMTKVDNPQSLNEMRRVYFRLLKKRIKKYGILDAYFSLSSFRSAMKEQKMLELLKKVADS